MPIGLIDGPDQTRLRAPLLPAHACHLAAHEGDLGRQRQLLGADVMTGQQRHAAEHALVVADQLVKIVIGARVARVEPEPRDLVQTDRA